MEYATLNPDTFIKTARRRATEGVVREPERFRLTGLDRVQFWRLTRRGRAPRPIQLTERSVGWSRAEIQEWITSRLNGEPWIDQDLQDDVLAWLDYLQSAGGLCDFDDEELLRRAGLVKDRADKLAAQQPATRGRVRGRSFPRKD